MADRPAEDYSVAASWGDITGSTLHSNFGSSSVIIVSSNGGPAASGNINVNDAVNWSANLLTLAAANPININAAMAASANLAGHYALGADVKASATGTWNSGAGFTPIVGNSAGVFVGALNGLGHAISGQTINSTEAGVDFFGYLGTCGTVQNVGLARENNSAGSLGSSSGIRPLTDTTAHVAKIVGSGVRLL